MPTVRRLWTRGETELGFHAFELGFFWVYWRLRFWGFMSLAGAVVLVWMGIFTRFLGCLGWSSVVNCLRVILIVINP